MEKFDEVFMEKNQFANPSVKGQGEKNHQNSKKKRKLSITTIATQDIRIFIEDEQVDLLPPPMASKRKS